MVESATGFAGLDYVVALASSHATAGLRLAFGEVVELGFTEGYGVASAANALTAVQYPAVIAERGIVCAGPDAASVFSISDHFGNSLQSIRRAPVHRCTGEPGS